MERSDSLELLIGRAETREDESLLRSSLSTLSQLLRDGWEVTYSYLAVTVPKGLSNEFTHRPACSPPVTNGQWRAEEENVLSVKACSPLAETYSPGTEMTDLTVDRFVQPNNATIVPHYYIIMFSRSEKMESLSSYVQPGGL